MGRQRDDKARHPRRWIEQERAAKNGDVFTEPTITASDAPNAAKLGPLGYVASYDDGVDDRPKDHRPAATSSTGRVRHGPLALTLWRRRAAARRRPTRRTEDGPPCPPTSYSPEPQRRYLVGLLKIGIGSVVAIDKALPCCRPARPARASSRLELGSPADVERPRGGADRWLTILDFSQLVSVVGKLARRARRAGSQAGSRRVSRYLAGEDALQALDGDLLGPQVHALAAQARRRLRDHERDDGDAGDCAQAGRGRCSTMWPFAWRQVQRRKRRRFVAWGFDARPAHVAARRRLQGRAGRHRGVSTTRCRSRSARR